jgi:uncharacterized protein (DUF433 family)
MMPVEAKMTRTKIPTQQLTWEVRGGERYEYFPLGKYVVAAPGVCGGRPTFKYTRLEVSIILSRIAAGETIEQVVQAYSLSQITPEAVREAIQLAGLALVHSTETLQPVAA